MTRGTALEPAIEARRRVGRRLLDGRLEPGLRTALELCHDYEKTSERERDLRRRELPVGMDHRDLAKTGWGVIFAQEGYLETRRHLRRLLELRQEQVKDDQEGRGRNEKLYRELVYQPPELARTFLWEKHGSAPGTLDPRNMPYYLLLVGSPEQIPWEFQYQLSTGHAVGRIWFKDLRDYEHYSAAVVAAETGQAEPTRRAAIFSVVRDGVTRTLAEHLVRPLATRLPSRVPKWHVEVWNKEHARKQELLRLIAEETPDLLLAACHGKSFPVGHEHQPTHQGALICQDRPDEGASTEAHYVHAGDLAHLPAENRPLQGLIAFLFACYGAGTPLMDDFPYEEDGAKIGDATEPALLTLEPFVAGLPRALLSRGTLGVVGHVDRGWTQSFLWDYGGRASEGVRSLEDSVVRLLKGHRLGHALRPVHMRSSELGTYLLESLESRHCFGRRVDEDALAFLLRAFHDARNFVILGDPAVSGGVAWEERSPPESEPSSSPPATAGLALAEDLAFEPATGTARTDDGEIVRLRHDLLRFARSEARAEGLSVAEWVNKLVEARRGGSFGTAAAGRVPGFAPITVCVDAPEEHTAAREALVADLSAARYLTFIEDPELADLRAHLLGPRPHPAWHEPAAALGRLDVPGWVVTDDAKELLTPFYPLAGPGAPRIVGEAVLRRACHLALRRLRPPAASPLNDQVTLLLKRREEGILVPAEAPSPGGQVVFRDGEEMALEIRNDFHQPVFTLLVDLGAGGGVAPIVPDFGPNSGPIPPGEAAYFESRRFVLPKAFPFHQPGESPAAGVETALLFATTDPVNLDPLFDLEGRSSDWREEMDDSALGRVLSSVLLDQAPPAEEDLQDPSWTTATQSLLLRRSETQG